MNTLLGEFCERAATLLADSYRAKAEALAGGAATDWADYKARVAALKTIQQNAKLIDEVRQEFERDADDD